MLDTLKDWRGWLRDWPLYAAGVLNSVTMVIAVLRGFALGAALAGLCELAVLVYSVFADAESRG